MGDGENIFRRLDDNHARMEQLVSLAHNRMGATECAKSEAAAAQPKKKSENKEKEDILAASALCQLAGPNADV
jgi:hypothetical protein